MRKKEPARYRFAISGTPKDLHLVYRISRQTGLEARHCEEYCFLAGDCLEDTRGAYLPAHAFVAALIVGLRNSWTSESVKVEGDDIR